VFCRRSYPPAALGRGGWTGRFWNFGTAVRWGHRSILAAPHAGRKLRDRLNRDIKYRRGISAPFAAGGYRSRTADRYFELPTGWGRVLARFHVRGFFPVRAEGWRAKARRGHAHRRHGPDCKTLRTVHGAPDSTLARVLPDARSGIPVLLNTSVSNLAGRKPIVNRGRPRGTRRFGAAVSTVLVAGQTRITKHALSVPQKGKKSHAPEAWQDKTQGLVVFRPVWRGRIDRRELARGNVAVSGPPPNDGCCRWPFFLCVMGLRAHRRGRAVEALAPFHLTRFF